MILFSLVHRFVFTMVGDFLVLTRPKDICDHRLIFDNINFSWWRHQMQTFSALLAICEGNPPVTGCFRSRGSLMFSLICAWTNSWTNNGDPGDLRRHRAHYDVALMCKIWSHCIKVRFEQHAINTHLLNVDKGVDYQRVLLSSRITLPL